MDRILRKRSTLFSLTGLAVGAFSVIVPLYLSEIAPENIRGLIVSLHQLGVTIGIDVSFWIGYGKYEKFHTDTRDFICSRHEQSPRGQEVFMANPIRITNRSGNNFSGWYQLLSIFTTLVDDARP